MKENFKRWSIKIWGNGKCLDLWSVNHTLAGGLLGAVIFSFNVNFYFGFLISFAIMVAWEAIEVIENLHEEKWNKIMDVVTGIAGFSTVHILFSRTDTESALVVFWVLFLCWAFLETWGFVTLRVKRNG